MKTKIILAIATCTLLSKKINCQTNNSNVSTNQPNANLLVAPTLKNPKKIITAYTMGSNLAIGALAGYTLQHSIGLYIDYRGLGGVLGYQSDDYVLNHGKVSYTGKINTETYSYAYNKNISTLSQQVNIGATIHLFGDLKKVSGTLLLGTGITVMQHVNQYNTYTTQGDLAGVVAVKDKDNQTLNANLETLFLLNIKWFNIHAGVNIVAPTFNQSAAVFGIGGSF